MKKVSLIIFREYWTRVRKRSFILTTLLAPVGFALFFIAVIFISDLSNEEKQVAVIDESGYFNFKEKSLKTPGDKSVYFKIPDLDYSSLRDSFTYFNYGAVIRIPENFDPERPNKYQVQVLSDKRLGIKARDAINEAFNEQFSHLKLQYLEIDRSIVEKLEEKLKLNYTVVGEEGEKEGFANIAAVLGTIMGFLIYISLFVYGTMVMKGVMEEKTSRIVEVIVSSVKPFQLLVSKIIGIGAVGITQYILWALLIFGTEIILSLVFGSKIGDMLLLNQEMSGAEFDVEESQAMLSSMLSEFNFWKIGIFFFLYYIGGYFLYGALFAAVGSATNDDGDLQSLTFPITIPIIISIFFLMAVIQDPDGKLAIWTSMIPFTSPIIMPARLAFDPPVFQLIISLILLIFGFLFTTWVAAKIYRTGILMYGKKITIRELGRWIFSAS